MGAIPFTFYRIGCVVAVGLSILGSVVLSASEDDENEPCERVILMTTGRILSGVATRNSGGWLVEQGNGRIHVPEEQVTLVASSVLDAYRKQRDSVVEPTPATHIALAQWCISYRLHNEARDELKKCLRLDPDHTAARKLLHRVDELLDPPTPKRPAIVTPRTRDGFLVPDVESLGGLSNEAALDFTQRIQPLLVNKCGNASCHGSATRPEGSKAFHLIPIRNGSNSHRIYTERNLAEIMKQIDISEPGQSPLLALPQGTHAGTSGIFHGSNGNAQLKKLRDWVKLVAREKQAEQEEIAERPSVVTKGRRPTRMVSGSIPAPLDDDVADSATPMNGPARPLSKVVTAHFSEDRPYKMDVEMASHRQPAAPEIAIPKTPNAAAKDFYKDLTYKDPDKPSDDSFDPEVFNRKFHGKRR